MIGNIAISEWKLALSQMKTMDSNFPSSHPRVDQDLYQPLKWSYDGWRVGNLENGFVYCAMFHEDALIIQEELVHMWIAEGLVKNKDEDYILCTGHSYVKFLVDRCLLQFRRVIVQLGSVIQVHDVFRDMASYIGENQKNCALRGKANPSTFPDISDGKRISIWDNNGMALSAKELRCSKLATLIIGRNKGEFQELLSSTFL